MPNLSTMNPYIEIREIANLTGDDQLQRLLELEVELHSNRSIAAKCRDFVRLIPPTAPA
jgi:hypothetical protein